MLGNQEDKSFISRKRLRVLLLITTIVLFISCIVVFISQYQQYRNIQTRIENVYFSINKDNTGFIRLISKYNEAENYFRLFSIDFDRKNYDEYEKILVNIKADLDSLVNPELYYSETDIAHRFEEKEHLAKSFILLKVKIDSILFNNNKVHFLPESFLTKKVNNDGVIRKNKGSNEESENSTKNYVLPVKKSLLKRIFDKQNDTIVFNQVEKLRIEKQTIIENHLNELHTQQKVSNDKLKELSNYFQKSRQNERELLANNFSILYDINKLIRDIQEVTFKEKQIKTNNEIKSLLKKTNILKWEMIICLFIMFILIGLISYYQYFSTYYENKLLEEKKYATKLTEEKTSILAEISHEIRTPINSLLGIVDILKKHKLKFNEQDQLLIESAFSSIQSTSKTINDILNLSKVENNQQENHITAFYINALILDVAAIHENQAALKNISIDTSTIDKNNHIIYTDEFKIRQILTNLITNGIKYSKKGTITISSKVLINKLYITIADQGIGIPQHFIPNVFRKYFTLSENSKTDSGVGLGLYITKKLVKSLSGVIKLSSVVNEGTTFNLEIPISVGHQHNQVKEIANISELSHDIHWLIVDDNPLNVLYMKQFFSHSKHVYTANNGLEALEIIENKAINLVITDINMPMMTGDQLLKRLKESVNNRNIPVIGTSSDNEQVRSLEQLHNIRFDGVLIKPFNEAALARIIQKTLDKNSKKMNY